MGFGFKANVCRFWAVVQGVNCQLFESKCQVFLGFGVSDFRNLGSAGLSGIKV